MTRTAVAGACALALAAIAPSCATGGPSTIGASPRTAASRAPPPSEPAAATYPDLEALYAGDQGIYRGCGPNNGVCHNAREFPQLASLGSVVDAVGVQCNQKRDRALEMHDLCERPGDLFRAGTELTEIGSIVPVGAPEIADARAVKIQLRTRALALDGKQDIVRRVPNGYVTLLALSDAGLTATLDRADTSRRTLLLTYKRRAAPGEGVAELEDIDATATEKLARAGLPTDPAAIQLGDPNRNGVYGADLGGRLIRPGDPAKSYLLVRLTDPSAGPPMPRANCCSWSKTSLRALYCWISGLSADGSNALAPIDYARCPPGPREDIEYPSPGPMCETSGKCPVQPRNARDLDDASWASLYPSVLRQSCGGASCHVEDAAGGLDFRDEERAYRTLHDRVVPGDARASTLFVRISPELCRAPHCSLMPRGRPPLDEKQRRAVERWIQRGALRE